MGLSVLISGIWYYSFSPRLVPWLRAHRHRYDVAVAHGIWNFASVGTWPGLAGGGTPYFVFAHGMLDPWFKEAQPLKWFAKELFWVAVEGRALRAAAGVLFTTEEERRLAGRSFSGHCYRERVVAFGAADASGNPNGQIAAFRARLPQLGGRPYLLFLSRIHPKKGCDLLIQAFAQSLAKFEGFDLVIAGPDQSGWRGELEAMAERLGVASRLHWPGMLEGDAKWGAYRACEVFVLPSHQENFGIVVAEAMGCSRPVLITDKVNIWREVERAGGGLVASDDLPGIASLLARFAAMPGPDRVAMGHNARTEYLARFSIDSAAADLVQALRETGA